MISYDTAKQLNNAAFEMKAASYNDIVSSRPDIWREPRQGASWYLLPTLSQLIDACGQGYIALERMPKGWHASKTPPELDNDPDYFGGNEIESGYQPTPEEAVAKLWLALNSLSALNSTPPEPPSPPHTSAPAQAV